MRSSLQLRVLAILLTLALFAPIPPMSSALAAPSGQAGEPGPSAAGVRVDPASLPTLRGETPQQVQEHPRMYPVDPGTFAQLKAQAAAAAAAHGAPPFGNKGGPVPGSATLGMGQTGGWNPPDGGLAVGPSAVLVAVNEAWAFYDKSGNMLAGPYGFNSFFGTSDSTYDPRALYDAANGRFVLLAVDTNSRQQTSVYTLAVSQSNLSTTAWCTYKINAVTRANGVSAWADFPALGMDGNYLYLTSNQFSFGRNSFQYARILAITKSSVFPSVTTGSCGTASSTDFKPVKDPDGSIAFTVQPANQVDAVPGTVTSSTPPMYFVNAIWSSGTSIVLHKLNTYGGLSLDNGTWVGVPQYNLPANAPQPGGSAIDTGDTRLLDAVYRYGNIYTANTTQTVGAGAQVTQNSSPNNYANSQWYVLTPGVSPAPTYAIQGGNIAYFYPGVVPGCSTATAPCTPFVGWTVSGSGTAQAASQFSGYGTNPPSPYAQGVAGYTLNSRWGDYPGVSADPTSGSAVWTLGEYAPATNAWGTATTTITYP